MGVDTRLAAARLAAAASRPYYATALFALEPLRVEGQRPATVDAAGHLLWNEAALASEPLEATAARIVHGLEHLLRDHAARGRAWTTLIGEPGWAEACDCEIDDDLTDLVLPDDLVTPDHLGLPAGQTAEWYAERLPRLDVPELDSRDGPPAGDDGPGGRHTRPAGPHTAAGSDPHEPSAKGCGCPALTDQNLGDDQGLSHTRLAALRRLVAEAVGTHKGDVPLGVVRWADSQRGTVGRVDWRALLLRHVRRTARRTIGASDYCGRRPSRRSPYPVLLPRLRGVDIHPAVVIDTSGSIDGTALADAATTVERLLRSLTSGEAIAVFACDTEVHAHSTVRRARDMILAGGGGSDMRPGIEAAVGSGADVVVVLTDGLVDWPVAPTRTPVIAGLLGHHSVDVAVPDWIPTVAIGSGR